MMIKEDDVYEEADIFLMCVATPFLKWQYNICHSTNYLLVGPGLTATLGKSGSSRLSMH